jgi:hypothetical protein
MICNSARPDPGFYGRDSNDSLQGDGKTAAGNDIGNDYLDGGTINDAEWRVAA